MMFTLPSGVPYFAPQAPVTFGERAATSYGSAILARDLEYNITAPVMFHRRPVMFQGWGGSQNVPASTWTPITLTSIVDNIDGHTDTDPSQVGDSGNQLAAGWHLCVGMVPIGAAATGAGIAGIRKTGGATIYEGAKLPLGSGHACTMMVADLVSLAAGDYVELMCYQNSGGTLAVSSSATKAPQFTLRWAAASASGVTVADPGVPRTWTAADLLTADSAGAGEVPWNVHVRDVLRWLHYPPAARLDSAGTSQTIPSGTWTSINFTAEQLDNYSGHVSSNSYYTVQRPGRYWVYGLASLAEANTTGYRASRLRVNGTTVYAGTSARPVAGSTIGSSLPAVAHLRLEVGDFVELQSFQSSGSSLAVKSGAGDASKLIVLWRGL